MAYKGGHNDSAIMPARTCHANGQHVAVPKGPGGAQAGERTRIPSGGQAPIAVTVLAALVPLIPSDGCYTPGRKCRLPAPCRHPRPIGQPDRPGTL